MLSIVIPYYNIRFFDKTLDSLAKQTNKNFSVYIGDDNSPDAPTSLIEKYKPLLNLHYYRFPSNLGSTNLTKQWERCIDFLQSEEWFMVLGDDDILSENVVQAFYDALPEVEALQIDVVNYATQTINDKGEFLNDTYISPKVSTSIEHFFRKIDQGGRGSLSENIFRKKIYEKCHFKNYHLAWHSDDMALLEFSSFGKIYSIDTATVFVRLGSENISGRSDNEQLKFKGSLQFYTDLLLNHSQHFTPKQRLTILYAVEFCLKKNGQKNKKINRFKIYWDAEGYLGIIRYLKRSLI